MLGTLSTGSNCGSDAAFAFDDQDSRFAVRMRNVFTTYLGEKDIPSLKDDNVLRTCFPIAHIDCAVKNNKHLLPIVYMPLVRLISPMQADRGPVHIRQVRSAPGTRSSKVLASNESHSFLLENGIAKVSTQTAYLEQGTRIVVAQEAGRFFPKVN
jgi:hypothetical protein